MLKNMFFAMLACFVFVLAGCGDNGSTDTSYIAVPLKTTAVSMNVLDDVSVPFEGAKVVLTNVVGGNTCEGIVDANGNVSFPDVPYGTYEVTIPGYSEGVEEIVIDADNPSFNLDGFKRLTTNLSFTLTDVNPEAGNVPNNVEVWLCDARGQILELELLPGSYDPETGSAVYTEKDVVVGRYMIEATTYFPSDDPVDGPCYAYTAEVDVTTENYEFAGRLASYRSVVDINVYAPKGCVTSVTLAGKKATCYWFDGDHAVYTARFYTNTTGSQAVVVNANGFEPYSKNETIEVHENAFYPLLTPVGQDATVAMVDFVVYDTTQSIEGLFESAAFGTQAYNFACYVDDPDGLSTKGAYIIRFYLPSADAQDLKIEITNYDPIEETNYLPHFDVDGQAFETMNITVGAP